MSTRPRNPTAARRELYILRGVPGSGKSGVADALADSEETSAVICSADAYFTRNGVYRFDPTLLGYAHAACFTAADRAMRVRIGRVIIDNCNIAVEHFAEYERSAKRHGYRVIHLVVEHRLIGVNAHGVAPEQVADRAARLRDNLMLGPPASVQAPTEC